MIVANTLKARIEETAHIRVVRKSEFQMGDRLVVETRNSSYEITSLGNGLIRVEGGWFDRRGLGPVTTTITGCTWGGSAIHADLIAGDGLFLEFGNRVLTTRIRRFRHIPARTNDSIH
ncbi:MAG TPA: hypothetical protein VJV75_11510 [Candidatus Polarisedimenticolia bacterium]|nr:hypothetical protein [Candidatus Polarisedimenticolia bacterium]